MKNILFCVLQLLVLVMLCLPSTYGQDPVDEDDGIYVNPKYLVFSGFRGMECGYRGRGLIYSIDFYNYDEERSSIPSFKNPSENFTQFGAKIGSYSGERLFRLQYQAGLAFMTGRRRTGIISRSFLNDTYNTDRFSTVSLTAKLGFKFIPVQFLSIGIDVEANLNAIKPYWIPLLSLEIGGLRQPLRKR